MHLPVAGMPWDDSGEEAVTGDERVPAFPEIRVARRDPELRARVISRRSLMYRAGADAALDRPAHVRGASSIASIGSSLAIIQDDANFIALVAHDGATVDALTLPAGHANRRLFDDRRGNKRFKLDLEASLVADDERGVPMLVAFGSGSTAMRERVAIVTNLESASPAVEMIDAPALYTALREAPVFASSDLNIEGAALMHGELWLFGRGNGRVRGTVRPYNATCVLEWAAVLAHLRDPDHYGVPPITRSARYDLGSVDEVQFGFTDAAPAGDAIVYSAAAEASPDAISDGAVTGACLGVITAMDPGRWAPITDIDDMPFTGKVEGIAWCDAARHHLWAVVDADDPGLPAELCVVELAGPWL
jgi:hypothetical protein